MSQSAISKKYQERHRDRKPEFYENWPWFGMRRGKKIPASFWGWVALMTFLALGMIYAFATLRICLAVAVIAVLAVVASLPFTMLLWGRI